jgi:hypothetical protein
MTTTRTSRKVPRLTVIVLVVVIVVDCFPCRQSEDDDDHEDDQKTPASYRVNLKRSRDLVTLRFNPGDLPAVALLEAGEMHQGLGER